MNATSLSTMTCRERLQAVLSHRPVDRLPVVEWAGWWDKTIERWRGEGLPAHLTDALEIRRFFGQDLWRQWWIGVRREGLPKPAAHGAGLITDLDTYQAIRPFLYPDVDDALAKGWFQSWADEQRRGDIGVWITLEGFFWFPRTLLGIEQHLFALYDQPELIHTINQDLADWMLRIVPKLCRILKPDFMTFAEDMSYNHGPMLSPDLYATFMDPYYRQVIPLLRDQGIVPIVDSDGDVTLALPWFMGSGMAGILPLERQAGVDVAVLRRDNPRAVLIGAYDKMVMNQDEAAMRVEFERLLPTARRGGLIISCDHQTPPGVSYQDYQTYLRLFREYAVQV